VCIPNATVLPSSDKSIPPKPALSPISLPPILFPKEI